MTNTDRAVYLKMLPAKLTTRMTLLRRRIHVQASPESEPYPPLENQPVSLPVENPPNPKTWTIPPRGKIPQSLFQRTHLSLSGIRVAERVKWWVPMTVIASMVLRVRKLHRIGNYRHLVDAVKNKILLIMLLRTQTIGR